MAASSAAAAAAASPPALSPAPAGLPGAGAGAASARSKKRPSSPGNGSSAKKRRVAAPGGGTPGLGSQSASAEKGSENKMVPADASMGPAETSAKLLPFKAPSFTHSSIGGAAAGKKNRTWKNLKQILASERALPWQLNDPSYFSIDAPPCFKPAKKYSDISGLPASYTDPQSKLRFSTIEEFAYIRMLPSDVVAGYLTLRKATAAVP
ncbi:PREDICTED: INO80 complex subunit C [Gekko japonicus]|uniref:INO80 complex subunit C n=1 Tax=Gekko japonicus TaxID=146911 RepID=A0ABM1JQK9_GEKJA|nr:PREDICTED: INO80 complex subunit C [Gekko japonicus]